MPEGGFRMRFTTNHDETAWDEPPVLLFGGPAGARAAFVAMALLPGPPLIYNGQEVESPQSLGLFVREPSSGTSRAPTRPARSTARSSTSPAPTTTWPSAASTTVDGPTPDDVIAYRRDGVVVLVNTRDRPRPGHVHDVDLAGAASSFSAAYWDRGAWSWGRTAPSWPSSGPGASTRLPPQPGMTFPHRPPNRSPGVGPGGVRESGWSAVFARAVGRRCSREWLVVSDARRLREVDGQIRPGPRPPPAAALQDTLARAPAPAGAGTRRTLTLLDRARSPPPPASSALGHAPAGSP
jgi:hypothetical protein